ncbi:MAG TPA: cyclopropane-fatty-acyl-phospholipid synthase family protein [Pseudomonadales bacterium]
MEKVADYSVALQQRDARISGWADSSARKVVHQWLSRLSDGQLKLEDHGSTCWFGETAAESPAAIVRIHDARFYREVLAGGSVGAAEAFMLGYWSSPEPVAVVQLMARNLQRLHDLEKKMPWVSRIALSAFERVRANTRSGSRRNIAAHYDLGNAFFSLFLDREMMYSSAIYPTADATLEQASFFKRDHICQRLQLNADDRVLEIGTGWGGMAIHAAQHYGCHVTTTTISREQYEYALARVEAMGLSDRIDVRLCDYRDLEGQYDKIISVEMIEAVGHRFMPVFFEGCQKLLKEEGVMLIQAITIPDQRYDNSRKRVDFIRRYIFPGGCLPSVARMQSITAKHTDFQWVGLEDITLDYARTLADWRERFLSQLSVVREQGFDETFIRMWHFYFAYCEGGFRERAVTTHQCLLARPRARTLAGPGAG